MAFQVPEGMALSVFHDKYSRKKPTGEYETWEERLTSVVQGNLSLADRIGVPVSDTMRTDTMRLALEGVIPFSGRHLQHGDLEQSAKVAELFANCATAMFSWAVFLLLMKGAGVGRDYSSGLCWVNWDNMPDCRFVLAGPDHTGKGGHPDYEEWIETVEEARHKYDAESEGVRWFEVDDSAEGWAKVVMIIETAAFHGNNKNTVFVFDFSKVRRKGSPLMGQQGRPASGPVPYIRALHRVASIKNAGFKPWKQALFIDHYLASCVVAGGVRRSARMAIKSWRDRDVIEFIDIKRGGFLWSANNSIAVDKEFWTHARSPKPSFARRVYEAAGGSSYWDNTGEPGFFNVDLINEHNDNLDSINEDTYISEVFAKRMGGIHTKTKQMFAYFLDKAKQHWYRMIPNPCGEVPLAIWGGYCFIGDVNLAFVKILDDALLAARCLAAALVRVNTMPCMYEAEVKRTNRIGVSLTGIIEFAWRHFKLGFKDLIGRYDGSGLWTLGYQAQQFWQFIERLRFWAEEAGVVEAKRYGLTSPATTTIIKPNGTVSKVLFVTEGANLPANRHYVRWVMMPKQDPRVDAYQRSGYPVKDVSFQYSDTVVVGFPTCLPIINEMPEDKTTTAGEATIAEHYRWLQLLENAWLGYDRRNGQISYTLKWRKTDVTYEQYMQAILQYQPTVRACTLMPEMEQDESAYAYVPEEPVTRDEYVGLVESIRTLEEVYEGDALICASGACGVEYDIHDTSHGIRKTENDQERTASNRKAP